MDGVLTLGEHLLAGRTRKEVAATAELVRKVFENDFGRLLLHKLMHDGVHPMRPRFNLKNPDPSLAAFRDGQADVIGFLYLNSGVKLVTPTVEADLEKVITTKK